jgi:hypothetical protein
MKTFESISSLQLAKLKEGQFVETGGYYEKGGSGAGRYFIKTAAQAAADGDVIDGDINHTLANGNVAILQAEGELLATQCGLRDDWNGTTGTDNSPVYKRILALMQNGLFNSLTFDDGEFYFAPISGKTTCVFLGSDSNDWQTNPNPIFIGGNGTIVIDNNGQNNVWMSGPEGDGSANPVNDVNIIGSLKITSSIIDRVAYDSPFTTMPNFGIGFNVSRWWRSSFTFRNEFAKGIVQAPSADGLYDSTNGFTQQITITNCTSTHAQENFLEFSQGWSIDIVGNTIERGNGGIDMQRSSGQSFFRTRVVGNTIQANGITNPFKCNFGVSFTFSSNYFESNRASSGVAIRQVRMSANNVQDLDSIVFEGNFFAQSVSNLDGFGLAYAHVELDAFNNFFPKGNNFTGGNGYTLTNSTGAVYSENETYTPSGSIYSEGDITVGGTIQGYKVTGKVYEDADGVGAVQTSKLIAGAYGFKTYESARIPNGTAYTFRKIGRPLCSLVCAFTKDSIGTFVLADAGAAPEPIAVTAATKFNFSATPTVPAAGRIDIAVNATSDGITVYNNLGSDRSFVLEQLGASDWA